MEIKIESNTRAYKEIMLMVIITVITQFISIIKLSAIASKFGASIYMDAFNFSNNIGTFIFGFIGAGITTVLIPAFMKKESKNSINNFITILYSISIFIVIVIFFNRYYIVSCFTSNSEEFINITCDLMLITLISQFFNTVISVYSAVFQCNGKFNTPKIINLICTFVMTIIILLKKNINIYEYASIIFIYSIMNFILQFYFVRKCGFRYIPMINLKDNQLKSMVKVFIPTVFSSGLYNISLLIDSIISSSLGQGNISILNYSNSIIGMINMLVISNLITYLYPKIANDINKDNSQEKLFEYIILISSIIIFIVLSCIIIGEEGIMILYQRGSFTSDITESVYVCFIIYLIGIPIDVIRDIIYRYFYANGDTKTTFYNSVLASFINISLSIFLSKIIGIYGLILGTVITSVISLITIVVRFKQKYDFKFNKYNVLNEYAKIISSAILSFILVNLLKHLVIINNLWLNCIVFVFCAMLLYIIFLNILKSKSFTINI